MSHTYDDIISIVVNHESLEDARQSLFDLLDDGAVCRCCDRFAKRYRRKFNSGMSRVLIWLVKRFEETKDWIDVAETAPVHVRRSNEVSRLVHWDMVEEKPGNDTSRRTSGIWRPTDKGIRFVYSEVSVPSKAVLYNNVCEQLEGDRVFITDTLGKKFNYSELMNDNGI